MKFEHKLNEYIDLLECTAKELSSSSGVSAATLSRYRSGERVPEADTETLDSLCAAIAILAEKKGLDEITEATVKESFLNCSDIVFIDNEHLRQNFNALINLLNINIARLCRSTNYDSSTIYRIRNGTRQPSEPLKFAESIAEYISREYEKDSDKKVLAELLNCADDDISDSSKRCKLIRNFLIEGQENTEVRENSVEKFLTNLNEFDLSEYIKAIHFDEMKVPSVPFQLSTSKKAYYGLKEMMNSELDFLKAAVLSKSMAPVIMYSDMPMEEMAKDPEFPKKWMFGMAMLLKKGLHLNQIHNLDRSFEDMMLGLESWIPMYMTGQVSPYYLKNVQNNVFLHLLKVSGTAALSGEAIVGYHSDGKYYLTKNKDEVAYYRKQAEELLDNAYPLMDIYRQENSVEFNAFLLSDSHTHGKRRSILSSLPIYTMDEDFLNRLLQKHSVAEADKHSILEYARLQKRLTEDILKTDIIENEVPKLSKEEFEHYPMSLSLSRMFYERDILYSYEDYQEHMKQTQGYAESHPNYILNRTSAYTFRNLQIVMHEGKWAMVSKGKSPAIHFVIHHPKLRKAIESFVPPVTEE